MFHLAVCLNCLSQTVVELFSDLEWHFLLIESNVCQMV